MLKNIGAILTISLTLAACGQETTQSTSGKNTSIVMTEASLLDHIKVLSSDAFGGRGTGSPGEELTVNYLVDNFKGMGLEPANGDSYIQQVPLISIEAARTASLDITDAAGVVTKLAYFDEQVVWTRQARESISMSDSDMVFVGYGINAPERGWNDYEGLDVKGKTVVILVNDPGYATQDEKLFNGNAMTYYGRWTYKFDEAAAQGAAGAIVIHDTKPAAYPWTIVQSSWVGPRFDIVRADGGEGLALMEAWITNDAANALFEKSGLDLDALKKAAEKPGFKAVPMTLKASSKIDNTIKHLNSRNVAAMIKGSETPDEIFVYMAHWDHLGTGTEINGDGIYNGALDNATGTAGLLELAKAFSSLESKPKRSILFLAVAAEEQGTLGSAYYGANPLFPLDKTVAGLNMDGLNTFGQTRDITIIGYGNSELDSYMAKIAASYDRILMPDPMPQNGYFYRSDHFELAKNGVPMLYPNNGLDHLEKGIAYGKAKEDYYVANDYHQPSDEIKDDWVMDGAIADLRAYYDLGLMVADGDSWPAWAATSGFKALRDEQLAPKP